jgi:hypothetical protein
MESGTLPNSRSKSAFAAVDGSPPPPSKATRRDTWASSFVPEAMIEQREKSGTNWQVWAGILVFLGIVATVAVAVLESFVG